MHGERCYLCGKPFDLKTMEVDHVLPEELLSDAKKLQETLTAFALPADFAINSFENWLPACRPCNGKKLALVFEPAPIVLVHLQNARSKAAEVAAVAERTVASREITKALNALERASEAGLLNEDAVAALQPLLTLQWELRSPEMKKEPIRITPLEEVLSDDGRVQMVRGPYGVGGRPSGAAHSSFDCPTCGAGAAWNGARCVRCGQLSDGD